MAYTNEAQDIHAIWDGLQKPDFIGNDLQEYEKDTWGTRCVFNVTEPTLSVYKARGENTGIGLIILAGGGYEAEGIYLEGHDLAKAIVEHGITAAVLKYRLPNPASSQRPELAPLTDVRRSLVLLRQMAAGYGILKDRLGLAGFSAGGHLATLAAVSPSADPEENPDFTASIYGVSGLADEGVVGKFETFLYHRKMTAGERAFNQLHQRVTPDTPPAFLVHAFDDPLVSVVETTQLAEKYRENNVLLEMHLFAKGGHAFGVGKKEDGTDQWVPLFVNWLRLNIR
jgi:acetyl esterase/lipase